jgi:hypothetical protein
MCGLIAFEVLISLEAFNDYLMKFFWNSIEKLNENNSMKRIQINIKKK